MSAGIGISAIWPGVEKYKMEIPIMVFFPLSEEQVETERPDYKKKIVAVPVTKIRCDEFVVVVAVVHKLIATPTELTCVRLTD